MNRLKSILVGVDFSECSKAALQQAARMAKWNGATLHVLHVIESMVVTELAAALKVPIEQQRQTALTGAQDAPQVWRVGEGRKVARVSVTLGATLDDRVVVTSGLNAGDEIVVRGVNSLIEGQTVGAAVSFTGDEGAN